MIINKGNFFNWYNNPVVVIGSPSPSPQDPSLNLVTVQRKWGGRFTVPQSELTPIAITPYYLVVSLHFNMVCSNQVILDKRFKGHHCTMVRTDLLTWCLILDGGIFVTEVKYIHELQNIFRELNHNMEFFLP